MANSADNPADLDESSDVAEMSNAGDESSPSQGAMSDPDLDDLGLALPEFRVSPKTDPAAEPGDDTGPEQNAAAPPEQDTAAPSEPDAGKPDQGGEQAGPADDDHVEASAPPAETDDHGSGFDGDSTMNIPASDLEQQLVEDASEARDEEAFDRAELVKTVRMDAFDRSAVEGLAATNPGWDVNGYLEDQRFAPDVLVLPPRVLTKKWQDGAVVRPNGSPAPGGPAVPSNRRALAATVKTMVPPGEIPSPTSPDESDEALELDSEAIEDISELHETKPPPPKPEAKKQRPGRVRRNTGPLQKPEPTEVPQAQADGDDDLSGIVQELLDEKKKDKPAQQKKPAKRVDDKRVNWFNDVFSEEYFRTLPPDLSKQTKRDVDFIKKSLGLQKGARVLDLACGFGRHSIQLAQADYEVAGLDVSMAMLQRALNEAQTRGLSIKFIHGDMRELNFNEIFDACFCWQTSFGYFDDRTNVQVAKGIARSLKPGGRFLIDTVNRDYVVSEMPARTWWEGHECVFLEEVEFDNNYSVLHTKRSFIYEDGSPPREFSSFIRLYSLHELRQLLHFSGFRVVEVSGAIHHQGSFLGPSSPRLIVLAEKVKPRG